MSSREVIRRLVRDGWYLLRVKGSHHIFKHADRPDRRVVVPHPEKDLPIGTLGRIMKDAGWSD